MAILPSNWAQEGRGNTASFRLSGGDMEIVFLMFAASVLGGIVYHYTTEVL